MWSRAGGRLCSDGRTIIRSRSKLIFFQPKKNPQNCDLNNNKIIQGRHGNDASTQLPVYAPMQCVKHTTTCSPKI